MSRSRISLAAIAVLVYAATLGHRLVWDDVNLRALVTRLMHEGGPLRLVTSGFALHPDASAVYYRPVVLLSLALDTLLSNSYPFVFHLTNLALHVACTLLVLALARALGAAARPAWIGALLFAIHPVHVEAVAFVSGRTDLWATFFALASALSWVRVSSGVASQPGLERVWSVAAYGLAVLSKEIAFALPAALIAWDALGITRSAASRATVVWTRRLAPWVVGWVVALALALVLRAEVLGVPLSGTPLVRSVENRNWSPAEIPAIVATCFRLLVFPWPLNAYYTPDRVTLDPFAVLASLLLFAAFAVTSSRSMRRAGLVALAWSTVCLLPAIGIVPIPGALVAERSLYLASVGISLLVALPWRNEATTSLRAGPAPTSSRWLAPAVASLAALMAIGTVARAWVWKTELTLFTDVAKTSPAYSGALVNLAAANANQGRYPEAIALSEQAVALRPKSAFAHYTLGTQYARGGQTERALGSFQRALKLRPGFPEALEQSALALMRLERPAEAESALRRLLTVDSTRAEPWNDLGMALLALDRPSDAADAFRSALRLESDYAPAHANLGATALELRRPADALPPLRRAIELDPKSAAARRDLGRALLLTADIDGARCVEQELTQIDPTLARELDREIRERIGSRKEVAAH